jgi:hypothetical protein
MSWGQDMSGIVNRTKKIAKMVDADDIKEQKRMAKLETLNDLIKDTQETMRVSGVPYKVPVGGVMNVDSVNHPSHYKVGGIETIEYMKAKATPEEFKGHLRLTAIKYLSRTGYKDDALQDLKKAQWYLNRLIKECENENG